MELTGICKEHFNKWLYHDYFKEYYQYQMIWQLMGETAQNAIIIEWFDLQSIIIKVGNWTHNKKTRQEVTKEAILKANEIYNQKQK